MFLGYLYFVQFDFNLSKQLNMCQVNFVNLSQ